MFLPVQGYDTVQMEFQELLDVHDFRDLGIRVATLGLTSRTFHA